MNKKISGIFVSLVCLVMLTIPAFASPTQGQKAAITLTWTNLNSVTIEVKISGNVVHRYLHVTWDVELAIDGGPTLYGTSSGKREMLVVPQKDGRRLVVVDYCELSFPEEEGGFEGNALIMMEGFSLGPPQIWERSKGHGLLQGTGAFEGQTINAGRHWHPFGESQTIWTGYLLKP
jgi:hypothetical protein